MRQERREAPEDVQWAIHPRREVEASLSEVAEIAHEAGVDVNTYACAGHPADAIVGVAEEENADLVIVGNWRDEASAIALREASLHLQRGLWGRAAPLAIVDSQD